MGFKTILVPIEQHDLMKSTLQTAHALHIRSTQFLEFLGAIAASSADGKLEPR